MRKESELIVHLQMLGLSEDEARTYVYLIQNGSTEEEKLVPILKIDASIFPSLIDKGILIRSSDNSKIVPLHPRNAAANLYKILQDKAIEELREKRKIADRLGMVLEPAFEASQRS